jgi:hypothetical protein
MQTHAPDLISSNLLAYFLGTAGYYLDSIGGHWFTIEFESRILQDKGPDLVARTVYIQVPLSSVHAVQTHRSQELIPWMWVCSWRCWRVRPWWLYQTRMSHKVQGSYVGQDFECKLWIYLSRTDELVKSICQSYADWCPSVELVVVRCHDSRWSKTSLHEWGTTVYKGNTLMESHFIVDF